MGLHTHRTITIPRDVLRGHRGFQDMVAGSLFDICLEALRLSLRDCTLHDSSCRCHTSSLQLARALIQHLQKLGMLALPRGLHPTTHCSLPQLACSDCTSENSPHTSTLSSAPPHCNANNYHAPPELLDNVCCQSPAMLCILACPGTRPMRDMQTL